MSRNVFDKITEVQSSLGSVSATRQEKRGIEMKIVAWMVATLLLLLIFTSASIMLELALGMKPESPCGALVTFLVTMLGWIAVLFYDWSQRK